MEDRYIRGRSTLLANDPKNPFYHFRGRNKMWIVIENLPPPPLPQKTTQNYLNNCETVFFAKLSICF
jgi:hypothetical protein